MDQDEGAELISRIFASITGRLEDAANDAAEGQAKGQEFKDQIARAERIEFVTRDIGLMAEAAAAVLRRDSVEP